MLLIDNYRMATASLRSNRLRSLLTMLGIIIAVVGVVTVVSIGEGVKRQVSGQVDKLGNDTLTVQPGKTVNREQDGAIAGINLLSTLPSGVALSEKDTETITRTQGVKKVAPMSLVNGVPATAERSYEQALIIGTSPALPEVIHHKVEFGSFFSANDNGKKVAVIGTLVAEKLFGESVPVGKNVMIRGQEFVVRGIFENFEINPLTPGMDFNNAIFIPIAAVKSINQGQVQFYEVRAQLNNVDTKKETAGAVGEALKDSHGGQDNFTVLLSDDTVSIANSIVKLITNMVIVVASISLFVGGIGIMNIMLVSVTERTREIGIRKAVGATNGQIRMQFMIEAAVLSVCGALIGVALSGLVNLGLLLTTDLQPVIQWQVVAIASVVSAITGVLFGAAPAFKASRKDPIEALRPM